MLVPNEALKLEQTRLYCPQHCRAAASLYDSEAEPEIFYVTFSDILSDGRSLKDVITLVDEIDVFLKLPARIIQNTISSPFDIITTSYKIFGVSATFGGKQVIRDITKVFPELKILQSPRNQSER